MKNHCRIVLCCMGIPYVYGKIIRRMAVAELFITTWTFSSRIVSPLLKLMPRQPRTRLLCPVSLSRSYQTPLASKRLNVWEYLNVYIWDSVKQLLHDCTTVLCTSLAVISPIMRYCTVISAYELSVLGLTEEHAVVGSFVLLYSRGI